MAQRLVRAKRKIASAGIPYRVPPAELLPERVPAVLAALYLIFNEGYRPPRAPLVRSELCEEAIRLDPRAGAAHAAGAGGARTARPHAPAAREARVARRRRDGDLVLLDDQDRSRWDRSMIAEGLVELERTMRDATARVRIRSRPRSPRCTIEPLAPPIPTGRRSWRSTRRSRPCRLAGGRAEPRGRRRHGRRSGAGLPLVDGLQGELDRYHLFHSARADLLRRLQRNDESAVAYRRALELATNPQERTFLERRLREVTGLSPSR